MEYYCGVRFDDFIIYSKDLRDDDLDLLQNNKERVIYTIENNPNSIVYDGTQYILYEWVEYFIIGLNNKRFTEEDFINIGKYYRNNNGSILMKNFIGYMKFATQEFQIISSKISTEEIHLLIEKLDTRIKKTISLSFLENGVSRAYFETNINRYLDFYVYIKLYNSLKKNRILPDLNWILKFPNIKFEKTINTVPLSLATDISNESLMDIFSGNTNLTQNNQGKISTKFNGFIPEVINEYNNTISNDTSENRFIKFFVKQCIRILSKFYDDLSQYSCQNQLLVKEVNQYREELTRILRNNFFSEISDIHSINHSSTILTRQIGYKQIYQEYINIKQVPINNLFKSKDLIELYNNKSVDKLYEYICLFRLVDILEDIYKTYAEGEILTETQTTPYTVGLSESNDGLEFRFRATEEYIESVLLFQHSFSRGNGGSFSVEFRPDFTIKIIDSIGKVFYYHFDSKFRVSNDGSSKNEDIVKMHAYCDGILKTKGAYVLFPGDSEIIYDKPTELNQFIGVGAFPLNFNNKYDEILAEFLRGLLVRR